ncbi:NR LBD domain-containing protein [Caenorhabditis elegans]|uniref:NR LBD domain-containing protein n=1 Tax=Caenorhabditis elegans TaxID=6239 RepID=C5VUJ4_CAEEL|nr:NR LBD domain-containing protein [Caenorhabditis elegans]CAZ65540.1 NR LBD domain-containing protein [Caenorhabditis elegans]|eukprot:NP_001255096.1 Uncharacterized protein CELE_Y48A6B.14 [Caenorhabditis elegans]
MSMIELNQEELMMVEAMVNCALHAEIAHNPPLVRLTPERQAFLRAMQTHPVTMQTLPGYLAHIGIDIKRLNAIDVLNYVAGQFYTGGIVNSLNNYQNSYLQETKRRCAFSTLPCSECIASSAYGSAIMLMRIK